jgi:hypothetical protein
MGKLVQADFGGGIWRDLDAPPGYVYDVLNGIVDGTDLRLRGSISTASDNFGSSNPVTGVAAGRLAGGDRVVLWNQSGVSILDGTDTSQVITTGSPIEGFSRAVVFGGAMFLRLSTHGMFAYAGSRKPGPGTDSGGGTITHGSRVLHGNGSSAWLTSVDAGEFWTSSAGIYVVDRVDANDRLTLRTPYTGADDSPGSIPFVVSYESDPASTSGELLGTGPISCMTVAANKLVICYDTKAWMTRPLEFGVNDNEFHDVGSRIRGAEALGGSAVLLFADRGTFVVENVALDLTDEAGNPQQQLRLVSPNLVLWHDSGLASWEGRVVAPCLDDVYLLAPDQPPAGVSRGIRPLYREYVRDGYRPGVAQVYQGHYVLPIIAANGGLVDVLVCRLDQSDGQGRLRPAWTRWSGSTMPRSLALAGQSDGTQKLLGTYGARASDLSDTVAPSDVTTDADGSAVYLDATTNDFATGPGNRNTITELRLRFALESAGNPLLSTSFILGPLGGEAETAVGDSAEDGGEDGVRWYFKKRCERVRFRVRTSGDAATLRLRSLEAFVRDSYRP